MCLFLTGFHNVTKKKKKKGAYIKKIEELVL